MPKLRLAGCTSRPLVNYLKALGTLRLVSLQADQGARGRWKDGVFELSSALDRDRLAEFFLEHYEPTPILSPWNGRCGFYKKGNTAAVANLARIEGSADRRLSTYRELIALTRQILSSLKLREKPESDQKERLVRALRRTWPDAAVEWLDTAIILTGRRLAFPPLLGSGGNDGSYDFSSNLMESLGEVLVDDRGRSASLLDGALHETSVKLERIGLAHLRRDASPTNSPWGEAPALGNPWDLVLSIEGTIALAAGASRKLASASAARLAAPFTVRSTGAGYGSAAAGESGRAELWLPLWEGWSSFAEITTLAREFRAQVGSGPRLRDALTGLDLARASGERGVALGLTAFERYALLERAGRSTLSVPAGRVEVRPRPSPRALREIDAWLRNVVRFAGGEHAPQGPKEAINRLQRRAYAMASNDDADAACAMLEALGEVEVRLAASREARDSLRPLCGAMASPWITAADDRSHEFALAVAIASLHDRWEKGVRVLPTVRDYLHGTRRDKRGQPEFDPDRRHAVGGGAPVKTFAELQACRHLDAERAGRDVGHLPWDGGAPARLDSLRLLATGALDERRLLALVGGLCTLRHVPGDPQPTPGPGFTTPEPALEVLLLAWHKPLVPRKDRDVSTDPHPEHNEDTTAIAGARVGWARGLARSGAQAVIEDAMLRLRLAGRPPILLAGDFLTGSRDQAELDRSRRLGSALLPCLRADEWGRLVDAQIAEKDETKDTQ